MEDKETEKTKTEEKIENIEKGEEKKPETKMKNEKKKAEEKKPVKKQEIKPKTEAVVYGNDLGISTKHSIAICDFIRKKKIEQAIKYLEQVLLKKKAIPMKGEIPHRKGEGICGGRYPINASQVFIKMLRGLAANSDVNSIEEPYIHTAVANRASRPYRRFGSRRFKRTNVFLMAKSINKEKKAEKKEKK